MKTPKFVISVLALFIYVAVLGQELEWAIKAGGSGNDWNHSIAVDKSKRIALGIINLTSSSTTFNGQCTITGGTSNYDATYCSLDSNQNCLTSKYLSKTLSEIRSIVVDDSGYVYMTGYFYGTKTFCSSLVASGYDVFVAKYTSSGNCIWANKAGGGGTDYATGLSLDTEGNVYVTGQFQGTATFGSTSIVSSGGLDGFIAKYDNSGNVKWVKRMGGAGSDWAYGVSSCRNGVLYVTGSFNSGAGFGPYTVNSDSSDFFLTKLDTSGNFIWVRTGGSNRENEFGTRVEQDDYGNIFVVGSVSSVAAFGHLTTSSNGDFLIKYDSNGNAQWLRTLGGATSQYTEPDLVLSDNMVYVSGTFGSSSMSIGDFNVVNNGANDIYVCGIDYSGEVKWVKSYGGTGNDNGWSMDVDIDGALYVTGQISGTVTMGTSITSSGSSDVYVLKIAHSLPIVQVAEGSNKICKGTGFEVDYKTYSIYDTSNIFYVLLSDTAGSFGNPDTIGFLQSSTSGSITCNVPGTVSTGSGYKLRLVATSPAFSGEIFGPSITISSDTPSAAIVITPTADTTICYGSVIALKALSSGGEIFWYTQPTGGTYIGRSDSGEVLLVIPEDTVTYYAEVSNGCSSTRVLAAVVAVNAVPATPGHPTSNSPQCANSGVTLTRTASPPAGTGWYWQATASGTDTTHSDTTYQASSSGTYYLRARNNNTGCWNPWYGVTTVVVNPNPSAPTSILPSAGTNVCLGSTVSVRGTSAGNVIDWYRQSVGGTLQGTSSSGTNYSLAPDTTTYYFAQARTTATGCVSTARTSTALITVYAYPSVPADPTSNSPQCASPGVTLTRSGTPPAGTTWYWQTSPTGTLTSTSGTTYNVSAIGTYYIRARTGSSCWSSGSGSLAVTIKATPSNPGAPTSNSPQCADVDVTLTRNGTPPTNVTWYWQTSASGTSTASSGSTYLATASGTYYIRARNDTSLCWSTGSGSAGVVVNTLPATPTAVTPSSGVTICNGQSSLVKATSTGNTINWFTVSTGGTLVGNSASNTNYTVYPDTTTRYYAEAKTAAGCKSAARAQTAVITVNQVAPPANLSPQQICYDTSYIFTWDSVFAGSGGNQVEWAVNSAFTGSTIISSGGNINHTVGVGSTDTIWVRSKNSSNGCVSTAVYTTGRVNFNPLSPVAPTSQSVCSDTAYTFTWDSIQVGAGGDSIEWSLNNDFSSSSVIATYGSITIESDPNTVDTVWLRSKVSLSGCISASVFTTGNVNGLPNATISPTDTLVYAGQKVELKASGSNSYIWPDVTETTQTVTVSSLLDSTFYTVIVTDSNGCIAEGVALVQGNTTHLGDSLQANIPLHFQKNMGQWDPSIKYVAGVTNTKVAFKKNGMRFFCGRLISSPAQQGIMHPRLTSDSVLQVLSWDLSFLGSDTAISVGENDLQHTKYNYYLGNDSSNYYSSVPAYGRIIYPNLYDHIDLDYYAAEKNKLEYDVTLKPGFDLNDVKFKFDGIVGLELDSDSNMVISTSWGSIIEDAPYSYQVIGGTEVPVDVSFKLIDATTYGFQINGSYDVDSNIIIDPLTLEWATFVEGDVGSTVPASGISCNGIAVDASNRTYMTGSNYNHSLVAIQSPLPVGINTIPAGLVPSSVTDAYVLRFSADASQVDFVTIIGSLGGDRAFDIALDAGNNPRIYITGQTAYSGGSPFPGGATSTQGTAVFSTRLNNNGTLNSSVVLDGSSSETAIAIAVDPNGRGYVTGQTLSSTFDGLNVGPNASSGKAFITAFNYNNTLATTDYTTFLSASDPTVEYGTTLVVDNNGNVYTAGFTNSISGFTGANYTSFSPSVTTFAHVENLNTYIAVLNSSGAITKSTVLGGDYADFPWSIDLDNYTSPGIVYLAGISANLTGGTKPFPVTAGSFNTVSNGGSEAFICAVRINNNPPTFSSSGLLGANVPSSVVGLTGIFWQDFEFIEINAGNTGDVYFVTKSSEDGDPGTNDNPDFTDCVLDPTFETNASGTGGEHLLIGIIKFSNAGNTSGLKEITYWGSLGADSWNPRGFLGADDCWYVSSNTSEKAEVFPTEGGSTPSPYNPVFGPTSASTGNVMHIMKLCDLSVDFEPESSCVPLSCFDLTTLVTILGDPTPAQLDNIEYSISPVVSNPHCVNITQTTTFTVDVSMHGHCIGRGTVTVAIGNAPSPILTTNPSGTTFCGVSSVEITASPPSGYAISSYEWNTSATTSSISAFSTGTYTVTVTYSNGCTASQSVSLTLVDALSVVLDGNSPSCQGEAVGLDATVTGDGSGPLTYTWSSNTEQLNQAGLYGFSNGYYDLYAVTVTNSYGCSASAEFTEYVHQNTCCPGIGYIRVNYFPTTPSYANDPLGSLNYSDLAVPLNCSVPVGNTIVNQNIKIWGTLVIDANVTWTNCDVDFGANAKIVINPGQQVTFDRCTFKACANYMWDGIYAVRPQASSGAITLNVIGCEFYDAKNAIVADRNVTLNVNSTSSDPPNIFYNNFKDIIIRNYSQTTNMVNIGGCLFGGGTFTFLAPHQTRTHTHTGIEVINCPVTAAVQIGNPSLIMNLFDVLDIGIHTIRANTNIRHNFFSNINYTATVAGGGNAVLSEDPDFINPVIYTTQFGGLNSNEGNDIVDGYQGYAGDNVNSFVRGNFMDNMINGMRIARCMNGLLWGQALRNTIDVQANTININSVANPNDPTINNLPLYTPLPSSANSYGACRFKYGVLLQGNPIATINVWNENTITLPPFRYTAIDPCGSTNGTFRFPTEAIRVEQLLQNLSGPVNVNGNHVFEGAAGLHMINIRPANWGPFAGNTVTSGFNIHEFTTSGTGSGSPRGKAFLLDNTENTVQLYNEVTGTGTGFRSGFQLNASRMNWLLCNDLDQLQHGMQFCGNCNSPNNIRGNIYNTLGLAMELHNGFVAGNGGIVGPQGLNAGVLPGNQYIGTFPSPVIKLRAVSSNGPASPFSVGNPPFDVSTGESVATGGIGSFPIPVTTLTTTSSFVCPSLFVFSGDVYENFTEEESVEDLKNVVNDVYDGDAYADMTKYSRKKQTYTDILERPTLLSKDTSGILTAYKLGCDTTNIGWLDSISMDLIRFYQVVDTTYNDEVNRIQIDTAANRVFNFNSTLVPENIYQENEQAVNDLYLQLFIHGLPDTVTAGQREDLEDIAFQCPFVGGTAVYSARTMLGLLGDPIWFDDEAMCDVSAYKTDLSPETIMDSVIDVQDVFSVFPNPTAGKLTVFYSVPNGGNLSVVLYDAIGQKVFDTTLNGTVGQRELELSNFASGIYQLIILVDGAKREQFKVSVAR